MARSSDRLCTQIDLMLPLLHAIAAAGGAARPADIYDNVATRAGMSAAQRDERAVAGSRNFSVAERQIRWTRQTAVMKGLVSRDEPGIWALTEKAKAELYNIRRGAIVTVFETDAGFCLWAIAEDAVGIIESESVQCVISSPPYPLARPKRYGNLGEREWVDDVLRHCESWLRILRPDGSIFLNVGPAWTPGMPVQTLHVESLLVKLEDQLGIYLLQELQIKTSGMGGALEWIGVRRIRVKSNVEKMLWLSPNPYANANNREVLQPYSASGLRAIAKPSDHADRERPSGYKFGARSFIDNGGAIPSTLISASNAGGTSAYRRAERAAGRVPHPATFPENVPSFAIKLASAEGDVIFDPMSGSGTTGVVAQRLGRRFICSERSRSYVDSARVRFQSAGFEVRDVA